MTYESLILSTDTFSMANCIAISQQVLPEKYSDTPWKYAGNHGTELLKDEVQLLAYMVAYGEMHCAKCREAFKCFDFSQLSNLFEIVDWGCGQGLATLTLIEILREHEALRLLRKITLIEPSDVALQRAELNVSHALHQEVPIASINKYLPYDGTKDEMEYIAYKCPIVIHLFSNILDIETIDLRKLALMLADTKRKHFVVCVGPCNSNAYRIEQFCRIFNPDTYFSSVSKFLYSYNSQNHPFSCYSKAFQYNGGRLQFDHIADSAQPNVEGSDPILDDYSEDMLFQNGVLNAKQFELYQSLKKNLKDEDHVFIKPNLNADRPDFLILRPRRGVMVIKCFDHKYETIDKKDPKKDSEYMVCRVKDGKRSKVKSPISVLRTYQDNLMKMHIYGLFSKSIYHKEFWKTIHMVAYFTEQSLKDVNKVFQEKHFVECWDRNTITDKHFDKHLDFNQNVDIFDDDLFGRFFSLLSQGYHSYRMGTFSIKDALTREQIAIAKSEVNKKQKISGVAGAGKTQVLICRALNALKRTHSPVLLLTFNISLINYILYRLNDLREDFFWSDFEVINYHQLIKNTANNTSINYRLSINDYDNPQYFEEVKDQLPKYKTILIDEIQDYKSEWIQLVYNYFLQENGEFVVFGDPRQNIYDRTLDKNGDINIGLISGVWNHELKKAQRFNNTHIVDLAVNFQKHFFIGNNEMLPTPSRQYEFNFGVMNYYNIGKVNDPKTLLNLCMSFFNDYDIQPENTVILSEQCKILRDIDYLYRNAQNVKKKTMTTFETQEIYELLLSDERQLPRFALNIENIRRNKKLHFTMGGEKLKLSTTYSYKGWEAETVILLIEPQSSLKNPHEYTVLKDSPALVYIGITRATKNLFVINLGNEKYDEFFKKNMTVQ